MTAPRLSGPALMACAACLIVCSGNAIADRPPWAGGGNGGREMGVFERREPLVARKGTYFTWADRGVLIDYYGREARSGHCPPGLRKRNHGCMPPGHAKSWAIGYPLPPGVAYYPLPTPVLMRLPPPPPRHRYVQVAGDILMIAVGSGMVVDAMDDLMR